MPAPSPSRRAELPSAALVGLGLAALTLWLLRDLPQDRLLGREGTDALRALWSLEILGRSLLPPDLPFWTRELNPPAGAVGLLLPWLSGLLAAPLVWALEPVRSYDLFVGGLLWAAGAGTAVLARARSGSWSAGAVAGAAMIGQPILLWGVADGAVEHAAIWALPLALALIGRAVERRDARLAGWSGLALLAVALDSPYHAVYAAILALPVLLPALSARPGADRNALLRCLGVLALGALGVGVLLLALRLLLPVGTGGGLSASELQAVNATNLESWARAERGALPAEGPAPTLIPNALLLSSLALSALALRRALPWVLAGGLALLLSLGTDPRLVETLGPTLGSAALSINRVLYLLPGLEAVRFPYRWLVPAALALSVGGAIGLARLLEPLGRLPFARGGVAAALGALALTLSARVGPFARELPTQALPEVAFTAWIRQQPEGGIVGLLPVLRPAAPAQGRNDRPVFAGLDPAMAGLDAATLQVLHGRPQLGAPGLQTLRPLQQDSAVARVLQDWDDLTHPRLSGNPIPPGANDPRADRARGEGMDRLIAAGLRWLAVDQGAYEEQGMAELRRQVRPWMESERTFEEGDGVLVWTLRAREPSP